MNFRNRRCRKACRMADKLYTAADDLRFWGIKGLASKRLMLGNAYLAKSNYYMDRSADRWWARIERLESESIARGE